MNRLPRPARRRTTAPIRRLRVAGIAVGAIAAALWSGCSIEKHHGILSFFFDGVPNPDQWQHATAAERQVAMRQSPTYTIHQPFAEDRCSDCHTGFQIARTADSKLCMNCHQGKTDEHRFMHGPVAATACLWCHAPHESAFPALLKNSPRDVCIQCHTPAMLETSTVPEHADPTSNCISCHSGHGGEVRFFLHNPAAQAAPPGD
jgi:predicted CXXCH cytochrome family protein